jgi:hypothetical protein
MILSYHHTTDLIISFESDSIPESSSSNIQTTPDQHEFDASTTTFIPSSSPETESSDSGNLLPDVPETNRLQMMMDNYFPIPDRMETNESYEEENCC